ncbi:MAG: hypothetical protein IJI45_18455 [Anaerolineaceae bacterium]|nr:hypothetical protein [Anaerolineaceae bacterium]
MTQHEQILSYMNRFGTITPFQAFADLGITKLATRISELKQDGVQIDKRLVHGKNRFGKSVFWAEYKLKEGKTNG